jgi:uncharacterized cupin superfamily protein
MNRIGYIGIAVNATLKIGRFEYTHDLYSNMECAVAPKLMGPPPHYHKELDELMYIIDGTASILIGGDVV